MSTRCNESWSPYCGPIASPHDATSQPGPTGWSPSVASASRWCSPLDERELEFLQRLNEEGEITADLLTSDLTMQATVREHPGLTWKALNVRKHHGRDDAGSLDEPG
jgi:hypothetical protein